MSVVELELKDITYSLEVLTDEQKQENILSRKELILELYKDFPCYSKEEIKGILGKNHIYFLKKIFVFYEMVKYCISNDPKQVYRFSTWNKKLQKTFGTRMTISNYLKIFCKINLLIIQDTSFHFNLTNAFENHCRTYYYNKKQALILKELFDELGFNDDTRKETIKKCVGKKTKKRKKYIKKRKVVKVYTGDLSISKIECKRSQLEQSFWKTNPMAEQALTRMEKRITEEYFKYPYLWQSFEVNFTRSHQKWTGASLRGYSDVCSSLNDIKKEHEINDSNKHTCRSEYISNYFKHTNWKEIDINASIYRVTKFLNTGKWDSDETDFYVKLNGKPFKDSEERNTFKQMMMRCYFGKSPAQIINQLCYTNREIAATLKNNDNKEKAIKEVGKYFYKMRQEIGTSFLSEIFMHETCIYDMVLEKILKKNIKCFTVYDCFYIEDKITEKEFYNIIRQCSEEYIKKYGNWIKDRIEMLKQKEEKRNNFASHLADSETYKYFSGYENNSFSVIIFNESYVSHQNQYRLI